MTARAEESERKRRPDSWEIRAKLTDGQLHKVFAWIRELGLRRAKEQIALEFNSELTAASMNAPSTATLSDWYDYYLTTESEERTHRAVLDGAAVKQLANEFGDVSEALTQALEAEATAAILDRNPDRIKVLVGLALRARQGRFEEKKYKDQLKTDLEKGLDAIAAELANNPEALELHERIKNLVLAKLSAAPS